MKGFASEALIVSGTLLWRNHPTLAGILLSIGILCALIRFSIDFGREQKKEKLLDAGEKILTSLCESSQKIDLSAFKQNTNFH